MNHIRDKLPDIKAKLNSLIGQTQQELSSYGDPTFTGKAHRVRTYNLGRFWFVEIRLNSSATYSHVRISLTILGFCDSATVDTVCERLCGSY